MSKRMLLLNLFLVLACIHIGRTVYHGYKKFDESHRAINVEPDGAENKYDTRAVGASLARQPLVPDNFVLISDKNLFLPSRTLESPEAAHIADAVPNLRPKPVLMGVAIVGDQARAFIKNNPPPGGQKATQTLRLGEIYRGYKVSLIHKNRVELEHTSPAGNITTQILDIYDPANRRSNTPVRMPVAQSQVINVGGGAANQQVRSAVQVQGGGAAVNSQGKQIIRTPFGDVVREGASQPGSALDQAKRQGQALLAQERNTQNRPLRRNETIDDKGRRIIKTPFGNIVRRQPKPPKKPPLEK